MNYSKQQLLQFFLRLVLAVTLLSAVTDRFGFLE